MRQSPTRLDKRHREQPLLFGSESTTSPVPISGVDVSRDPVRRMSRATDGATSREAAENLVDSGDYAGDSADALALVLSNPGRTGYELDAMDRQPGFNGYGLNRDGRIRKRLAGLADCANPQIERGPARMCFEKGTKCQTWWPIGTAPKTTPTKERN